MKLYKHLCQQEISSNLSSHDAIVGQLYLPQARSHVIECDYSSSYTPFLLAKPKWDDRGMHGYQTKCATMLENLINHYKLPQYIPLLSELFSKPLVLSAERNFDTFSPSQKAQKRKSTISLRHKQAYDEHETICKAWRKDGRPRDPNHPSRVAKLNSQRKLQNIAREERALKARLTHDDLMSTFNSNISQVCNKLKKIRGEPIKKIHIPFIETLKGTYSGNNVLEGFCANTETLCNFDSENFEHKFYKLCHEDNMIIFKLTSEEPLNIPHMTLQDLKHILFTRLKLNKACDIYKLTVEHLRYAGDETLSLILILLNSIIDNITYLSSTQLSTAAASILHKGKGRSLSHHKSFRQVRVTPLLGRCIDEFIRPNLVKITKNLQNNSQYGFTENITYMMG